MASTVEKLTQTLLTCLSTASTLCSEIKNNRHCGSTHTQLDLLEISLSDGSSMISARCAGLEGMVVDEEIKKEFEAYNTQLVLLCGRLESIAHPSHSHTSHHSSHKSPSKPHSHEHKKHEHKHDHRSRSSHSGSSSDEKDHERNYLHKHRSNTKPLIFSAFEPLHHHHGREVEDPHFGELRGEWEGVSAGILGTLAGLRGTAGEGEESIVKEVERVEINEEGGAIEEVVKEVEKVEIREETKEVEVVRYVVKHVEGKETETVVVEVEEEHHQSHGEDISPPDSGSGREEGEERDISEVEVKEMEVRA